MKKFKRVLKLTSLVFAAVMLLCAGVLAAEISDIGGHWSEEYVKYGVEKGYINGYPDGTFLPNNSVTRAEFSKMINSALGITKEQEITFFDVETNDWFYPEVRKAVYAGYIAGYENGSFMASNLITRQEAAVILSRIATRPEETKSLSSFKDASDIADWAKASFEFAYSKGFITGDDLGNLAPKAVLTRAQAAKIIYSLLSSENIVNSDYTFDNENALCSETIFTDNVYYKPDSSSSLTLDGCRILGNFKVLSSDKTDITVKNSGLSYLGVSGSSATVSLSDSSSVKYLALECPADISGEGYERIYVSGDNLISGITSINAECEKIQISTSAILSLENAANVEITKSGAVTIQSGTVKKMTVAKAAANCTISLAESVTVKDLTVNAACSFMGKGTIESAVNNANGISYQTRPKKLSGIDSDESSEDEGAFAPSSYSPAKKATSVSTSSNISITFPSAIYTSDGEIATESYIHDCIEIRKNSATGSSVSFSAALSSGRTKITLNPTNTLSGDTRYYVIIKSGAFANSSGDKNEAISYYFTTKEAVSSKITFLPENAETKVSVSDPLKITFSSAVYDTSGDTLTNSYLSRSVVELREKSATGNKVSISASISSNRIITITPDEILKPNTRYYMIINSGTLQFNDGTAVPKTTSYFTTSTELEMAITPKNAETSVSTDSEIVLEFNSEIYRSSGSNITSTYLTETALELRKGSASGTKVDFEAIINSDRKTVRIIPAEELLAGTRYYVIVLAGKLANSQGEENSKITSYFTTASQMAPSITPVNGDDTVSPSADIVIKFSEALYTKTGEPITAEYVEQKAVVLKKTSSSGTAIPFEALISSDYKTITISPKTPFSSNTKYYVSVVKSSLYNESGKANSAASSTFTTTSANKPDFIPYNGETDVEVSSNIEITFDRKMYAIGGAELTTTYLKNNVIELYKDSYDGEAVAYSVSLSSDKQTFIINPTKDLEGDSTYVIVVRKSSMEDANGTENPLYTSSFETAETISTVYTITPVNKATGVSLNPEIVLDFESSVYRPGGIIASEAYILNNVFELRKASSSGAKVECTAFISNDNKTITVTPVGALDANTTYYVKVVASKLEYSNGSSVASKSISFKTGDGKPIVSKYELVESAASAITVTLVSDKDGTAYVSAKDSAGNIVSANPTVVTAGEETEITVSNLASNTSYTVIAYTEDENGVSSGERRLTAKTLVPFTFELGDITSTSIELNISTSCAGNISVSYKAGNADSVDYVTGLSLRADVSRSFTISGLANSTSHKIEVIFTDTYGASTTISKTASTTAPAEEVLEITSLKVICESGDEYTAVISGGKASLTIFETGSVKFLVESSVENSTYTVDAATPVNAGSTSAAIAVTAGEKTDYEIVLTSGDTGKTVSCTVSISVNE